PRHRRKRTRRPCGSPQSRHPKGQPTVDQRVVLRRIERSPIAMLLMIDNYDSFTYNLVQYLSELGADVQVYRNDALTLSEVAAWKPEKIVLSPGPCTPSEAGICVPLIQRFAAEIP